ncbi:hypothetical protein DUI87_32738 [Hirundo rustica rustica]|uniref:NAD(P)(+)--arginine ADP-ribosyltransferase n=1 Tax=Hirundo rustica rustica TaxID=333673 RepID=A0A3M0IQD1_HIRRU|nr:hypothetical protein DUI87_32738 [Hirundo rustica rustica]
MTPGKTNNPSIVVEERPSKSPPTGCPLIITGRISPVGILRGFVVIIVTSTAAATSMPRLPLVAGRSCLLALQPLLVSRRGDCSRCSSSFLTSVDRRWCYVRQRGILHTKPLQHYTLFGYVRYCRNENISCEHQKCPTPLPVASPLHGPPDSHSGTDGNVRGHCGHGCEVDGHGPNSFDDQYLGCGPAMTAALPALNLSEFKENLVFAEAWREAVEDWKDQGSHVPSLLSLDQAIALRAYTMEGMRLYQQFNVAVREAGSSSWKYRNEFHFKSLHFLLTQALQKLRRPNQCYDVFRWVNNTQFKANKNDKVRFGQFASSSMDIKVAWEFGHGTIFKVNTCHGVDIQGFTSFPEEEEVGASPGTAPTSGCFSWPPWPWQWSPEPSEPRGHQGHCGLEGHCGHHAHKCHQDLQRNEDTKVTKASVATVATMATLATVTIVAIVATVDTLAPRTTLGIGSTMVTTAIVATVTHEATVATVVTMVTETTEATVATVVPQSPRPPQPLQPPQSV